jgi:signal recognition particle receptor subunit beta
VERVRTILERELEKRRQSSLKGVGVGALGEAGEENAGAVQDGLETLGDGPFSFAKWEGGDITIIGGCVEKPTREKLDEAVEKSGATTAGGLDGLESWLHGL